MPRGFAEKSNSSLVLRSISDLFGDAIDNNEFISIPPQCSQVFVLEESVLAKSRVMTYILFYIFSF